MPTIVSAADIAAFMDDLIAVYVKGIGTSGTGYGLGNADGSFGSTLAAANVKAQLTSMTSTDFIAAIAKKASNLYVGMDGPKILARSHIQPILASIDNHIRECELAAAVVDLESYLYYLNITHATKWQALMPYQWRDIYYKIKNTYPDISNLYFEILQGSVYANGLRKHIVGTGNTAGDSVDTTKYAGGFPKVIASNITGSGVVTVTGTQYNPATEAFTAGKTWTATVTGNGTFALAVGTADTDSLIAACSSIAAAAGITVGTIYAEAHRPTSRDLIS